MTLNINKTLFETNLLTKLNKLVVAVVCIILLFSLGCDESINPAAGFVPRMSVYSILSTQSDTQFVRIYTSYSPPDNNPLNNPDETQVTDATVTITDGTNTYTFRDTTVQRPNTERYQSSISMYYCYPMGVEPNKQYFLQVTSPTYGSVSSQVAIPSTGLMQVTSNQVLNNPLRFERSDVTVGYELSPGSSAYLIRLYIVYTADNPWEPIGIRDRERYFEVPVRRIATNLLYEECNVIYPEIRPVGDVRYRHPLQEPRFSTFTFSNIRYRESLSRIQRSNFNIKYRRAVFYFVQFDDPWYKHYTTANRFQDKLAVRLDEPSYSNINGGAGVFASFRVDSAVTELQESIRPFEMSDDFFIYCQQEAPPSTEPLGELRKLTFRP